MRSILWVAAGRRSQKGRCEDAKRPSDAVKLCKLKAA